MGKYNVDFYCLKSGVWSVSDCFKQHVKNSLAISWREQRLDFEIMFWENVVLYEI